MVRMRKLSEQLDSPGRQCAFQKTRRRANPYYPTISETAGGLQRNSPTEPSVTRRENGRAHPGQATIRTHSPPPCKQR